MILWGLVWFSIVCYANVYPCKVSNGLVWLFIVLYGLTQLCTIFVLVRLSLFLGLSSFFQIVFIFEVVFILGHLPFWGSLLFFSHVHFRGCLIFYVRLYCPSLILSCYPFQQISVFMNHYLFVLNPITRPRYCVQDGWWLNHKMGKIIARTPPYQIPTKMLPAHGMD